MPPDTCVLSCLLLLKESASPMVGVLSVKLYSGACLVKNKSIRELMMKNMFSDR